jgi:hypothetical protein
MSLRTAGLLVAAALAVAAIALSPARGWEAAASPVALEAQAGID